MIYKMIMNIERIKKGLIKSSLRVLLLLTILLPMVSPLVMSAKEPVLDAKENIISNVEYLKNDNISEEKSKKSITNEYSTNTAYGQSTGGVESGTGVIGVDVINMTSLDYKINAITHEITLRLTLSKDITADSGKFTVEVSDGTGPGANLISIDEMNTESDSTQGYIKLISSDTNGYVYEVSTGDLSTFAKEGQYTIVFKNKTIDESTFDTIEIPGTVSGQFNINVPKTTVVAGVNYAVVGDGINSATDADNLMLSDKIEPGAATDLTATPKITSTYGIYEMESIGYEEANAADSTVSNAKADWSATDLTLAKYDHVIRPIDGNYALEGTIDATQVNEGTSLNKDIEGGWSTSSVVGGPADINDGFRPIGQIVGTTTGYDSMNFSGQIEGNNNKITNLYIDESTLEDVGLVSKAYNSSIQNLGIVDGNITGGTNVGAITGSSTGGSISNSYTSLNITGTSTIGGIIGYNSASSTLNSSYSDSVIIGNNELGGLVGSNNSSLVNNSYALGPITGTGVAIGGLVGISSAGSTVSNTYALGNATGVSKVGGLVGENSGSISNSYAAGDVTSTDTLAGGLVGQVTSGSITNSFEYETQLVNGFSVFDIPLITGVNIARYENLITSQWYVDTLGWSSTGSDAPTYSWTAPVEKTEAVSGIITYCHPYVYSDTDLNGNNTGNTSGYVPEQYCNEIGQKATGFTIENYKINALNLGITIYLKQENTSLENEEIEVRVFEDDGLLKGWNEVYSDNYSLSETTSNTTVIIPGSDTSKQIIKENSDYKIEFYDSDDMLVGILNIHTPNLDAGTDGILYTEDDYGLIGDGVNLDTFVSSSSPDFYTDSALVTPTSTSGKYGVYELESIGYEDVNSDATLESIATPNWSATDLTLYKYDHIIRPIGNYKLDSDINASATNETIMKTDAAGGWSTDSNADNVADINDGFRPIGQLIGTTDGMDSYEFDGTLDGGGYEISNLYINESTLNRVGLVSYMNQGEISNLGLTNNNVTGKDRTGGLVGYTYFSTINNSYTTGDVTGVTYVGGLVGQGLASGEINNSYTTGNIAGTNDVGGLIGQVGDQFLVDSSYATGVITAVEYAGGLVGAGSNGIVINNSYATGNVTVTENKAGGLVGVLTTVRKETKIENSYATGVVTGGLGYIGGLVGETGGVNIYNSYATGNVTGGYSYVGGLVGDSNGSITNSYATGDVVGTENVGGLVGYSNGGSVLDISNTYALGNVTGTGEGVGGLVGKNANATIGNSFATGNVQGSSKVGALVGAGGSLATISNSYAYEMQNVNSEPVDIYTILGYTPNSGDNGVATSGNLLNSDWYINTLNWSSSGTSFQTDLNWTSPWKENIAGEDKICFPYVYADTDLDTTNLGNLDYVPGQTCEEIPIRIVDFTLVNYKIDAFDLSIELHLKTETALSAPSEVYINLYENDGLLKGWNLVKSHAYSMTVGSTEHKILLVGSTKDDGQIIKANTEYKIEFSNSVEVVGDIVIHTPSLDAGADGILYNEDDYALIGDGVNSTTFVSSSSPEFYTDTIKSNPTTTSGTYGIYELESIGYEDSNPDDSDSISIQKSDWSATDLTLYKYDHIIRPSEGNYKLGNNIDASVTNETNLKLDVEGGWSTASVVGGIADINDGFRPIGQIVGTVKGSDPHSTVGFFDGTNYEIGNIYIDAPELNYVSIFAHSEDSVISNVRVVNSTVVGYGYVSGLVGRGTNIEINNCYASGSFTAEDSTVGALVGYLNYSTINESYSSGNVLTKRAAAGGLIGGIDNYVVVNDSYSSAAIQGGYKLGGLIGSTGIAVEINNCYATGTVQGEGYLGGLVGNGGDKTLSLTVNNSYSTGDVTGTGEHIGGLIGNLEGTVNNSYATGNVQGFDTMGGLVGSSLGNINNSYSTGDVVSLGNEVGGLVGTQGGSVYVIKDSYATGDVSGLSKVGGLVGSNNYGKIENSYSAGDVSGTTKVGALEGVVTSSGVDNGLTINSYAYESQFVNGVLVTPETIIGSGAVADVDIATYDNLTTPSWYTNTALWSSTGTDVDNYSWHSPWVEDIDADSVDDYCHPRVYADSDLDGTNAGNTDYVPNQPCVQILEKPIVYSIDNFKIDATTLDIVLRLSTNSALTEATNVQIDVYKEASVLKDFETTPVISQTYPLTVGSTTHDIAILANPTGSTQLIEENKNYKIEVSKDGASLGNIVIHTPRIDPGMDGVYYNADDYALIGDGINTTTFVSSSSSEFYEETLNPRTKTATYGIYELESIGYEEANPYEVSSLSTQQADWSSSDLTLAKYDHVIRPIDGRYKLGNVIDAMDTNEDPTGDGIGILTLDKNGGWSSDTDNNGTADVNDGFRPIGRVIGAAYDYDYTIPFTGVIEGARYEVSNLYINQEEAHYVGMIAQAEGATIQNLGVEGDVTGFYYTGILAGSVTGSSSVINCYSYGEVQGVLQMTGGLIGSLGNTDLSTNLSSSYSSATVSGNSNVGGLVGVISSGGSVNNSYATGNVTGLGQFVGGLVGQMSANGSLSNSYSLGNVTAGATGHTDVGGLVGSTRDTVSISNSFAVGNVSGASGPVGGIVGGKEGSTVTVNNSYSYENQLINGALPTSDIVTYSDLTDPTWYVDTLGWSSTPTPSEAGYNWLVGSSEASVCLPIIFEDTDLDGTNAGNLGEYVPNQACNIVTASSEGTTSYVQLENYKIDALTLDVTFDVKVKEAINKNVYTKIVVNEKDVFGKWTPIVEDSYRIPANEEEFEVVINSTQNEQDIILPDKDYKFEFYNVDGTLAGYLVLHTPKQSIVDGETYGIVGEEANNPTFVESDFYKDTSVKSTSESKVNTNYELESIGYEDTLTSKWSENDLTLTKYDHIIRSASGSYRFENNDNVDLGVIEKVEEDEPVISDNTLDDSSSSNNSLATINNDTSSNDNQNTSNNNSSNESAGQKESESNTDYNIDLETLDIDLNLPISDSPKLKDKTKEEAREYPKFTKENDVLKIEYEEGIYILLSFDTDYNLEIQYDNDEIKVVDAGRIQKVADSLSQFVSDLESKQDELKVDDDVTNEGLLKNSKLKLLPNFKLYN